MFYQILVETAERLENSNREKNIYEIDKTDKDEIIKDILVPYLNGEEFIIDGYNLRKEKVLRLKIVTTNESARALANLENSQIADGILMYVNPEDILEYDKYVTDVTKILFSEARSLLAKSEEKEESERQTIDNKIDKTRKLFISHSSKDVDYVKALVDLLEILGLRDEEIICSSVPPYCIPLDGRVYDWLVNEFQKSELHVVYILSENYYASAASLNEMGAAWAMKHKWTGILLPGFSFEELDGCIDKTQISIKLDDTDRDILKFRLSEFKDKIISEFNLRTMAPAMWERQRDEFFKKIEAIIERKPRESKALPVDKQHYTPTVGTEDVANIPVESAFLLVYAVAGDGKIFRISTLGSPVEVFTGGKQFLADTSQRESARWQEALDWLCIQKWVKAVGSKGEVFEVTGTGYKKADWLKEGMQINTDVEPLEELKEFDYY